MTVATYDARADAQDALDHLSRGDVNGATAILESLLEAWPPPKHTISQDAIDRAALTCMIGPTLAVIDRKWASRPPRHSMGSHLQAEELNRLRHAIHEAPESLIEPHAHMRDIVGLVRSLASTDPSNHFSYLSLLEVSAGDAWSPAGKSDVLRDALRCHRALQSVGERTLLRLVWAAREAGLPQREIANLIDEPQTQIFRQLRQIDDDPTLLSLSPREILDHYKAGEFDREVLISLLSAYPYTRGEFPPDEPDWGYLPGSWDQLTQLVLEGEISRDELEVIVSAAKALTPEEELHA